MRHLLPGCSPALVGLLVAAAWIAAADDKPKDKPKEEIPEAKVDPMGMWPKYKPGLSRRYQIWYDKDGWQVRTTTAGELHRFQGSVHVEGGYIAYFSGGEKVEQKKKSKNKDYGFFNPNRTSYTFDFTTKGHEDILHFRLSGGAKKLFFHLKVDDKEEPELIYIGKDNKHPPKANFYLPAFPEGKK